MNLWFFNYLTRTSLKNIIVEINIIIFLYNYIPIILKILKITKIIVPSIVELSKFPCV